MEETANHNGTDGFESPTGLGENNSDSDSDPPAPGDPSGLSDNQESDTEDYLNAISEGSDSEAKDSSFMVYRSELFDSIRDEDLDDPAPLESLAPGFFEHPAIRNTYICVFVLCSLQGGTWDMAAHMLEGQKAMLTTLVATTPGLEIPGLGDMAMTLPTVEHRLGLDPDMYIRYYFLYKLSSECSKPLCPGTLWIPKPTARNPKQRVPTKIFPYAPMLHCPEGDEPGPATPLRLHERINDAGLECCQGGIWGVEDVDVHDIDQRFINIDWFQASKGSKHSVGTFYLTIKNNHRSIQFLREETILVAVFPGPTEPSLEELNCLMEPFAADMLCLYNEELVHTTLADHCLDLPASRKAGGLRGCCRAREDGRFLKYSFKARNADTKECLEIAVAQGKRWSVLDLLPGWMPGRDDLIDYMHAVFLCCIKHLLSDILFRGGMFTQRHKNDENPETRFEEFLGTIWWPSNVGRLSESVLRGSGLKADQLRNVIVILPVALWHTWNVDGTTPDGAAPAPSEKSKTGKSFIANEEPAQTMDRNYRRHFDAVLQLCVSNRIYASHSTSPYELQRAAHCYSRACQEWANLRCHLTPYHHIGLHLDMQFLRVGPSYAAWALPYERHNGFLAKIKHNRHTGGELEATMMRGWVKAQLVNDLVNRFESLPGHTTDDKSVLRQLHGIIKGDSNGERKRGTLLNMLATMAAEVDNEPIKFPAHSARLNLHDVGYYGLVLEHLRMTFMNTVQLVPEAGIYADPDVECFNGRSICSFSNALVSNQRYGAGNYTRGKGSCFAYIDGRSPVRIEYILKITHERRDDTLPPLTTQCAIIRHFYRDSKIPDLDWALWGTDLGLDTWYANTYEEPEVIDLLRLNGHMAITPLDVCGQDIWVTISLSHVSVY
ncbi:hypothetical protein K439DRAFT_1655194 [Ramaria rubella]|nr:hypothetical protein K439DRAFT_1655194 [Ramaria rubella]